MHLIGDKSLARRTFLKGAGAAVALPLLDAMIPTGRLSALARVGGRTRFVCIEEVHGVPGCNEWGAEQHYCFCRKPCFQQGFYAYDPVFLFRRGWQ